MTSISIAVEGVREFSDAMDRLNKIKDRRLRDAVSTTAIGIQRRSKENMTRTDTGRLRSSIGITFDSDKLGAQIGPHTPPYDAVMEHGRRAGARMPPPDALIEWIRRHNLVKRPSSSTMRRTTYMGVSIAGDSYERALKGMAWVLARKIARKGIRPLKYMTNAYDVERPAFERNVAAAMNTSISEAFR